MIREGGLLEYMSVNFPSMSRSNRPPPPSIARQPDDWFTYWDEDGSGVGEGELRNSIAFITRLNSYRFLKSNPLNLGPRV